MPNFKSIKAWQKADDLVVEVYAKTRCFPPHELYGLTAQMRRAAISVCSNIAEGSARESLSDYIRFLFIAQ
jgi:four helix bundle protein